MIVFLAQQAPDALVGSAGWAGAGILGLVLGWLLLVHLPGKDKQAKDLLEFNRAEREKAATDFGAERAAERLDRHDRLDRFQTTITAMAVVYEKSIRELQQQHKQDAAADREAFLQRNDRVENAIRVQTADLKAIIDRVESAIRVQTADLKAIIASGACRLVQQPHQGERSGERG